MKETRLNESTMTLDISILGREYRVACKESEKPQLLQAVKFLDGRMREIRDGGKIAGAERIAVMAALNISNEMLRKSASPVPAAFDTGAIERRISSMQAAIDRAMADQEKLI